MKHSENEAQLIATHVPCIHEHTPVKQFENLHSQPHRMSLLLSVDIFLHQNSWFFSCTLPHPRCILKTLV